MRLRRWSDAETPSSAQNILPAASLSVLGVEYAVRCKDLRAERAHSNVLTQALRITESSRTPSRATHAAPRDVRRRWRIHGELRRPMPPHAVAGSGAAAGGLAALVPRERCCCLSLDSRS